MVFCYTMEKHSVSQDLLGIDLDIFFDHSQIGILISGPAGEIVKINDFCCQMFGYEEKDLLGEHLNVLVPDRFHTSHLKQHADFHHDPHPRVMGEKDGMLGKRKDGSEFPFEISLSSFVKDGKRFAIAFVKEIEARLEAERKLRESLARFEMLAEQAPVGIFLSNADGECTYVNKYWCKLAGLEMEEAMGFGWIEAMHPQQRKWAREEWENAINEWTESGTDEYDFSSEFQYRPVAGQKVYVTGKRIPIRDEEGKIKSVLGISQLTKGKKAEERILQLHETYSRLVRNLPGAVFRAKPDEDGWPVLFVSEGIRDLTGFHPEEFMSGRMGLGNIIFPEDRERMFGTVQSAINARGSYEVEYRMLNAQGNAIWVWERGSLIEDAISGELFLEGFVTEVTDRVVAKEQLSEMNQALERKVKERTSELAEALMELQHTNGSLSEQVKRTRSAEEQATRALEKERQLNELKSRFISTASHEFRTPLTTIKSSASLLKKIPPVAHEDKWERNIERIHRSVAHLTSLLNDFLSLEKLQSGDIEVAKSEVRVEQLLEVLKDEMLGLTKPGQTIEIHWTGPDCPVVIDRKIVHIILTNLLSNGIKYSPPGSTVRLEGKCKNGNLFAEVIDEGMGIPEEEQKYLFQRFFRAKNATNLEGTGLGLNIVYRYLELLGGQIDFSSIEGKGSRFKVIIPYDQPNENSTTD